MTDTPFGLTRRELGFGLLVAPSILSACAKPAEERIDATTPWRDIEKMARGQTVNWQAWAGDPKINDYIKWTSQTVKARYGVDLNHVKTSDTTAFIQTLLADKSGGRTGGGRNDLIWLNGENFSAAKGLGLLWGPFAERLPNWKLVDVNGKPSTINDFTLPTEGYESPWGMAQLTFFHDAAKLAKPPRSISAMLSWAKVNRGRFAYPAPPDFTGVTFLKQALLELSTDRAPFYKPVNKAEFGRQTEPLWAYLDQLHPTAWRGGKSFPPDYPSLRQLLEDQEIDIAFAFNPAEALNAVNSGLLPPTTRAYILDGGTIQNTHFQAIPFNSSAKAGAMIVANFLLSPEAQARKADPRLWGDATVLDLTAITPEERRLFDALPRGAALPDPESLTRALAEPHPSWMLALGDAWRKRYAT
jgi:putative thiamine transport system substrate-binding protein